MLVLRARSHKLDKLAFVPGNRGIVALGWQGAYWWPTLAESKPIRLGAGSAVGWVESEVEDWLRGRIEASRKLG